jgi:cytochrome c-type biogenesis protein CcmH
MPRLPALILLTVLLAACGGNGADSGNTVEGGVGGLVSLDPQLADQVTPQETVFLFARRPDGPPMPLAIQRLQVQDLPYRFRLDDSHAMTDMTISSVDRVVVVARVSRSGQAMPASGDLEGQSGPVTTGTGNLEIVIDRVLP